MRKVTHSKYSRSKNCSLEKSQTAVFFQYTILFSAYEIYDYISKKNKLTKEKIGKIKNAFSTNEDLSVDEIRAILYEKSNTIKQVYFSLTENQIASYFPKGYTMQQMEEVILTLLDEWSKKEKR